MKTTKSRTLISIISITSILYIIVGLLCVFYIGKVVFDFVDDVCMKEVASYTEYVDIIETFYTTDRHGTLNYHIMWEGNNHTDVMDVCSSCYMRYRDAAEMPIKVTKVESKNRRGYNFCLHKHYNYERTDK